MTPIRVLHCPEIVAGNAQQLARAEREVGLESIAVAFEQTAYAYEADEIVFKPSDRALRRERKRFALLRRALRDFDVVHFNFGRTLMPVASETLPPTWSGRAYWAYARLVQFRDLPLLERAGKGIVVTYQGDDARQGDYSLAHFEVSIAAEAGSGYYTPESDAMRRRSIAMVDRYADAVFALNPDLLHVLPARAEFLPYTAVDVRAWRPVPSRGTPPVVIHAPTHRGAKGTRFVLAAVEQLRSEGIPFEFVLVEGLTRREAREVYERADLLVDQVLAGWYGGLAVELMALGKPVIAYIRREDLDRVPDGLRDELPIIEARPDTIADVLRRCLTTDRERLPELGARGRAYVEHWHDPIAIARRTKQTYERILGSRPSARR
jgi:glycosyltransferase involved in cell wall biosynthesis